MKPTSIAVIMLLGLSACSTGPIKPVLEEDFDEMTLYKIDPLEDIEDAPPQTHTKGAKTLELVRVMEGGACKNEREGVEGLFLLYAYPDDVERIKITEGTQVFGDFEHEIETIAAEALQETINGLYIAADPFFPDSPTGRQDLLTEFSLQFADIIDPTIEAFEQKTTLTIEILPFSPSLHFYLDGCDLSSLHGEE